MWEWNEAVIGSSRGCHGGVFNMSGYYLHASGRNGYSPTYEDIIIGFRVAEVPEPATLSLLGIGGLALIRKRRTIH